MYYKNIFILMLISLIIVLSSYSCTPPSNTTTNETNPSITTSPNATVPSPTAPTEPDPLIEIVLESDLIVLGTIANQRNEVVNYPEGLWGGKHAYTIYTLSVEKVMKGDPATKEVFIRASGGDIGEVYQGAMGWHFSISDQVLLNLHREEGNVYTVPDTGGVLWIEGVSIVSKASLEYVMGCVARIMKDNNIPIALDEPIPMPAEPVPRPDK